MAGVWIVVYPLCLVAHLWQLEGGTHLPGKVLIVLMARDLHKFLPPRQCQDMSGMPLYPLCMTQEEGSRSLDINIGGGGSPSSILVLAGDGSSPPRNSWRKGSSCGGHSRSSSPLSRVVPASSPGPNQSALGGTSSVYHKGGGNW